MKTKHNDIIKGYDKRERKPFLARVSSLHSTNIFGEKSIEAITVFNTKNMRIIQVVVADITHNFGEWDRELFKEKYPEHIIWI